MGHFPLVRSEDLVRDSVNGLSIDTDEHANAITQALEDMEGVVEDYLNRELAVRETTQVVEYKQWDWEWGFNYAQAYLSQYPVVEIIEVTDEGGNDVTDEYSLHTVTNLKERMIKGPQSFRQIQLRAYTGYRRKDQTLAQLQDVAELADLTELPMALPNEIRSVITELTLNRLLLASMGQMGTGQVVSGVGNQNVEISAPDQSFIDHKLCRLVNYIRVF